MTTYYYFEINDHHVNRFGAKYFYQVTDVLHWSQKLLYVSDRIWELDCTKNQVSWTKNRIDPSLPIDQKEFVLVQLKAKKYV